MGKIQLMSLAFLNFHMNNTSNCIVSLLLLHPRRVLKNLLPLVPQNSRIAPADTEFYIESGIELDFCSNQNVDTSVRIVADTAPGMTVGICSAEASNFFTIGFVPDTPCQVAVDLTCFVMVNGERVNCKDVPMPEDDTECVKEVTYVTIVTNVGEVDKAILSLDRTRDGEPADLLGLLDRRDLAPGEFATALESGLTLDFCVQRLVTTSKLFILLCVTKYLSMMYQSN